MACLVGRGHRVDPGASVSRRRSVPTLGLIAICGLGGTALGCKSPAEEGPEVNLKSATPVSEPAPVLVDGSSTVLPISKAVLALYASHLVTDIRIEGTGTGSGFKKFCGGKTAINGASRPITTTEMRLCADNHVEYIELPIAFDGVAVVVGNDNDFLESLTVAELEKLWGAPAEGSVVQWSDLRKGLPAIPVRLAGPGLESGTFDFFTTAIIGGEHASRSDYKASEDDQELVDYVATTPGALAYFGLAYYAKNRDRLRAVPVDDGHDENGKGAIMPSPTTIADASYEPLSRPLFFYVSKKDAERTEVRDFVEFYLRAARLVAPDVGYVALPESSFKLAQQRFEQRQTGTIFEGAPIVGLTIEDLMTAETHAAREAAAPPRHSVRAAAEKP